MPRWTEQQLRETVATADSFSDVLRHFDLRPAGGNHAALRTWIERWEISIEHFTYGGERLAKGRGAALPLQEALVEHSRYSRSRLKKRLYAHGLKAPRCELCGQDEEWNGRHMSLILDHVNGIHDDNRLDNLRIVCPNCNATLPTHCGKNVPRVRGPRRCLLCERTFQPSSPDQSYCSRACYARSLRGPRPGDRKVERPPYEQLLREIATSSWSAVGRKYGVSCNAVRKWVQMEQRLRAEAAEAAARGEATNGEPERRSNAADAPARPAIRRGAE